MVLSQVQFKLVAKVWILLVNMMLENGVEMAAYLFYSTINHLCAIVPLVVFYWAM